MSIQLIPKKLILPKGFFASGLHSGIKKRKVPDLSLLFSKKPAVAAGVFTTNRVKAWNVKYCQRIMSRAKHHAFLTNSGNANCYNGPSGKKTVEILARQTGQFLKINSASIFVSATGIIGRVFPIEKAVKALPRLVSLLSTQGGHLAVFGILTIDWCIKEVMVRFKLGVSDVIITGFSKGAGGGPVPGHGNGRALQESDVLSNPVGSREPSGSIDAHGFGRTVTRWAFSTVWTSAVRA
jgi:glutamate N-acetyltransferase/amino-acid N-acetyltransferase